MFSIATIVLFILAINHFVPSLLKVDNILLALLVGSIFVISYFIYYNILNSIFTVLHFIKMKITDGEDIFHHTVRFIYVILHILCGTITICIESHFISGFIIDYKFAPLIAGFFVLLIAIWCDIALRIVWILKSVLDGETDNDRNDASEE